MSRRAPQGWEKLSPLLARQSHPPIVPLPRVNFGNNVPHSMKKTRRTWHPNVKRYNLPVNVLGNSFGWEPESAPTGKKLVRYPELKQVQMGVRDIKQLDRKGGLEGYLLSAKADELTPYGRKLRTRLFDELHHLKKLYSDHIAAEAAGAAKAAPAEETPLGTEPPTPSKA